jgi:aspartate carbamoyltransferase regulatory subunit
LFAGPEIDYGLLVEKKIDAVYVTRFQKERWAEKEHDYLKIDSKFLAEAKYSEASVMHPLPRVDELDASVDSDRRAIYFQQAAYGVPVRMALIALLLGAHKGKALRRFEGGFDPSRLPNYNNPKDEGIRCTNVKCIVHEETESQYVRNKFHLMKVPHSRQYRLRCAYCETDIEHFVIANKKHRWFTTNFDSSLRLSENAIKDIVAFSDEGEPKQRGFHQRRHGNPSPEVESTPAYYRS